MQDRLAKNGAKLYALLEDSSISGGGAAGREGCHESAMNGG